MFNPNKIHQYIINGGISNQEYKKIYHKLWEDNRKNLFIYCLLTFIGMLILFVLSNWLEVLKSSKYAYLLSLGVSLIMLLFDISICKKRIIITKLCTFVFTCLLFAFGILLGTLIEPNQASASYGILLFAIPLLFTDRPIVIAVEQLLSMIVYIILAKMTQSNEMFMFNLSIVLPYGFASIILGIINMKLKITRLLFDYTNKELCETDQLTGMLNRRSYDERLSTLSALTKTFNYIFIDFDINGLKLVNDKKGNIAGDELVCATAELIQKVFGKYGSCYRIGGKEFFAIIDTSLPVCHDLEDEFNKACNNYNGKYIGPFSVSMGYVQCTRGTDVKDAVHIADNMMYQNKLEYHKNSKKENWEKI